MATCEPRGNADWWWSCSRCRSLTTCRVMRRAFGVTVKLRRAHGGCLGDQRRRRTWTAAKSSGEPLTGFDPEISEWGNPRRDYLPAHGEYITMRQPSQGTETSKYLDERKSNETPLVVASERGRA